MINLSKACNGFALRDVAVAARSYGDALGVDVGDSASSRLEALGSAP
ncbi:MAG TPA: hypothetical protein VJR05_10625 [Acidimicrobiia bacterium]|nr:hypothetical protein [Acidimicrobiia bacterium]